MKNWKLVKYDPDANHIDDGREPHPYIVEILDEFCNVTPFSAMRYDSAEGAYTVAQYYEDLGYNVRVSMELAFCYNAD